ncbi:MAG: DUF368 domain-containing protein [Acidimicrobiia bacterium]|nr:DUF368 domain-containing protein [Acidimicrobiia bacterium]
MSSGLQFVRGFLMGAADVVPGVSGGTIALVVGIYERLIDNIHRGASALARLLKGDIGGFRDGLRSVDWLFLVPLGLGIVIAFVSLAGLIRTGLEDYPEPMAGLFLGLVLGSVVIALRLISWMRPTLGAIAMLVGVAVFLALGWSSGPVSNPTLLAFFAAGGIAICAMILPGISGSFILLMLGMYTAVLDAVHDRDVAALAVFTTGAAIGLGLFSTLLTRLLGRYHDIVMAVLIGLMLGSVRVLWPWPNGVGVISDDESEVIDGTGLEWPEGSDWVWPLVWAAVGLVAVLAISRLAPEPVADETATESV